MSVPASRKRKRLLCRFNLKHNWRRAFNPEGQDYTECKACGKQPFEVERTPMNIYRGAQGYLTQGW